MSEKRIKDKVIDLLLDDRTYHIEFNGHLTNHSKHAVIALAGLGASDGVVKNYYDNYALQTPYGYGLEMARASKYIITKENWQVYLGKRTSFSSFYNFFDQEEKLLGKQELLRQYLPYLIAGWLGSLAHAAIHLGWALDVNNRTMMLEGLAYMAFSYISCHPERAVVASHSKLDSVLNSLLNVAGEIQRNSFEFEKDIAAIIADKTPEIAQVIHPELMRSGLQYKIAKMLLIGHPLIYKIPSWVEKHSICSIWQQLHYVVALLYLVEPGNFLILHLVTSLHAMEKMSEYLSIEQQRYLIKCFWIGMLCKLFSQAKFPSKVLLESLDLQYGKLIDVREDIYLNPSWSKIIAKAICEVEEHNPKLVYVLSRMWKMSGYRSVFRIAASHFTVTPELPSSFKLPIND